MDTALLIIDVQNELFNKRTPVYKADELLSNICELAFRAHNNGLQVVYVQHDNSTMPQDTEGWMLHSRLQPRDDDLFFRKQHSSAFEKTNLDKELKSLDIHKLFITGLVTHGCVQAACLDGIKLGYEVILVGDGHSNFHKKPEDIISETQEKLIKAGIVVQPTREIKFQ